MSKNSPGRGFSPWTASLPNHEIPLDFFPRSGVSSIPVAIVPASGGFIKLNNPQATQEALHAATPLYQTISDVRQFGRGGILCRSPDQTCVADLLKCTSFAAIPVRAFIPTHLACTKGVVRGVDSSLTPTETLEKLSAAGVIAVYRCNRVLDNTRVPTESVIATFAGTSCPSEIKIWPLIFRVDPLAPRPLQCRNCWRFGHSIGACKSSQRCCTCGESHAPSDCTSENERCCLCEGNHPADYSNCSVRAQEVQILEVMDKRRCSRREAVNVVNERTFGYAGVTAKQNTILDSSLTATIENAVQKAVAKAMDQLLVNLGESIAQAISSQMNTLMQATGLCSVANQLINSGQQSVDGKRETTVSGDGTACNSSPTTHSASANQTIQDCEMKDAEHNARAQKRAMSTISEDSSSLPLSKSKKCQSKFTLEDSASKKSPSTATSSS